MSNPYYELTKHCTPATIQITPKTTAISRNDYNLVHPIREMQVQLSGIQMLPNSTC
jgi:hypothetical protein